MERSGAEVLVLVESAGFGMYCDFSRGPTFVGYTSVGAEGSVSSERPWIGTRISGLPAAGMPEYDLGAAFSSRSTVTLSWCTSCGDIEKCTYVTESADEPELIRTRRSNLYDRQQATRG